MTIQDQTIGSQSNSFRPEDDGDVLDANAQSAVGAEGHMPKIRKPYTITKQRERWTEEEHEKFLEALKLYGRTWRKIEEHVGTKTAVQIRSHAQKFFSKVVRESGSGSTGSSKPIEIPPPRAKRKPMHPYPRKLVVPSRKEAPSQENLARSTSLNSSDVEQANQSPTSVLSVVASHTLGSADSNTQNGSTSPLSSATAVNNAVSSRTKYDLLQEENSSKPDDLVSVKLELFPKVEEFGKEDLAEATSLRTLKLFGKVVEVSDSGSPSNSLFSDGGENLQQHPSPAVDTSEPCEARCNQQPYGMIPTVYLMNCSSNGLEIGCASAVPWWSFYGGVPVPFVSINSPVLKKEFLGENLGDVHKEGSLTCSDTGSANALENGDRKTNAETESHQCPLRMYKELKGFRPFLKSKDTEKKSSIEKPLRGFVPYKRCHPDRDTQSSTITVEERKGQRTKLCL